jgi:hypothetical protein
VKIVMRNSGGEGTFDLWRFFTEAHCDTAGATWAVRLLEVPTVIDLEPSFPVLVEAGEVRDGRFEVTHRARRMPLLRFDRAYPRRVRQMNGEER